MSRLSRLTKRTASAPRNRPAFRPRLEALEDRAVPSSAILSNGVLTVTGDPTGDTIIINVQGPNVVVTHNSTTDPFVDMAVSRIEVRSLGGSDYITVERLTGSDSLLVDAGDEDDEIHISPTARDWATVGGGANAREVNGGNGTDTLFVYDQNNPATTRYEVVFGEVRRDGSSGVAYQSCNVVLNAGNGVSNVFVFSVSAGTKATVNGGGADVFEVTRSGFFNLDLIHGDVSVDGGAGAGDTLSAVDWGTATGNTPTTGRSYELKAGSFQRLGVGKIEYTEFEAATFGASLGDDTVDVYGATVASLLTYDGNDRVNLHASGIPVSVNAGGNGATGDSLIGPDAPAVWTVIGGVSNINSATTFEGFENLTGNTQQDRFLFQTGGTVAGSVDGGGGSNTIEYPGYASGAWLNLTTSRAAGVGGTVQRIQGLVGGPGPDTTLTGPNQASTWNVTGSGSGDINNQFTFSAVDVLTGGGQADRFAFAAGFVGRVNGGNGSDTLDFAAAGNVNRTWNVTAANYGNVQWAVNFTLYWLTFSGVESLTGGGGNDNFVFDPSPNGAPKLGGRITAGGGADWLDYSGLSPAVGVTVNLTAGAAGRVYGGQAGGVSGIEHVRGSPAADTIFGDASANILLGMGGNDTIEGWFGFDLLIGGDGADTLTGGIGDDILIGGLTSHDTNNQNLLALLAAWDQSAVAVADRQAQITAGVGPNRVRLDATTVTDDGDADTLTGSGNDWLFLS